MVGRRTLQYSFRVTTAAALVLAVMTSPMRPAKSAGSYCFNHQRRDFDVTSAHSCPRLASALADSRPVQVKALPSEREEELSWTTRPACRVFDFPPALSPKPERDLVAIGLDRAMHPLRC